MKKRIFNKYVDKICKAYYIEQRELFAKDKRSDLADARHLLYYLSLEAPMTIAQLRKYMMDNDYKISHSTIYHGYNKIKLLTETNDDIQDIVKSIKKECIN